MSFSLRNKFHTRRLAWLLMASFLFQATLPILAQAASAWSDSEQLPYCSLQGLRFTAAPGDDGGAGGGPMAAGQLCPVCLFSHLAHISLPVTGGPLFSTQAEKDHWLSLADIRSVNYAQLTLTPIRAPPHV